jgi:lysozyme
LVDGAAGASEPAALNHSALTRQLIEHEGMRLKPYDDKTGEELRLGDTLRGKLTVGIGRNLTHRGISTVEAHMLLSADIVNVIRDLDHHLPSWRGLDGIRQLVLADMAFNLGVGGLMQFTGTLQALGRGDYHATADHMLASLWASQVGKRAKRLALMMDTGQPVRLEDVA